MVGKIKKIKGLEEKVKRIPRLIKKGLIIGGLTTSLLLLGYTPVTIENLIQNPQRYEAKDVEVEGIPIHSDFIASYNTIEFYLYLADRKAIRKKKGVAIVGYDYIPKFSANAYGGFFESLARELDAYIKLREAYPNVIKPEIKVYGRFHKGKKRTSFGKGDIPRGIEIWKVVLQFYSGETKTFDFLSE